MCQKYDSGGCQKSDGSASALQSVRSDVTNDNAAYKMSRMVSALDLPSVTALR